MKLKGFGEPVSQYQMIKTGKQVCENKMHVVKIGGASENRMYIGKIGGVSENRIHIGKIGCISEKTLSDRKRMCYDR